MPTLESPLYSTLQELGIKAPLDLPDNERSLHAALAQANGIPTEEAFEWIADKFQLLPFRTTRPGISVPTENVFRQIIADVPELEQQPWLPVGVLGPLLIVGHYNPTSEGTWGMPSGFLVRVLLDQPQYEGYLDDLRAKIETRPLQPAATYSGHHDLEEGCAPETALKWLLQTYPFRDDEKVRLKEILETLSGVAAAHVMQSKALPPGYGAALRHLCTGEACFTPWLAPRQTAFPESLLEKHAVFPLYAGVHTVYMLSSQKETFGFEDEWL